jgi:hypothetical protein
MRLCLFILVALICLPSLAAEAPLTANRPNIIFILADDSAYADFGCYGQGANVGGDSPQGIRQGTRRG